MDKEKTNNFENKLICPSCGNVIEEIEDHFYGCDKYQYSNGIYIQKPRGTIEKYEVIHTPCGNKLPEDMVVKIAPLMKGR